MATAASKGSPSGYAKNVVRMGFGAGVSQIILLLSAPLLTRLYGKMEFGIAATFMAVANAVAVTGAFRYEQAVVIPDDDDEARAVLRLCLAALGCVTAAAALLGWAAWASNAPAASRFRDGLALLAPSVGAGALLLVLTFVATRLKRFKLLAGARVANTLLSALGGLGMWAVFAHRWTGLVAGYLLGTCVGAAALAVGVRDWAFFGERVSLSDLRAVAKRHIRIPRFNLPMSVLDLGTAAAAAVLLATRFTPVEAGFFALAQFVLAAPIGVVGAAFSQVLFERASRTKSDAMELGAFVSRNVRVLSRIGAGIAGVAILAGPPGFSLVFGPDWRAAGVYAAVLSTPAALSLVASPLSGVPTVLDVQHIQFRLASIGFALRIVGVLVGVSQHSPLVAVCGYATADVIQYSMFLAWLTARIRYEAQR